MTQSTHPVSSTHRTSRLSGFYQLSLDERVALLAAWAHLTPDEVNHLAQGMGVARGDKMIENVVGRYDLPLAIATNFTINGRDYLIPLVVEEPSVVAALSFAARLARHGWWLSHRQHGPDHDRPDTAIGGR